MPGLSYQEVGGINSINYAERQSDHDTNRQHDINSDDNPDYDSHCYAEHDAYRESHAQTYGDAMTRGRSCPPKTNENASVALLAFRNCDPDRLQKLSRRSAAD